MSNTILENIESGSRTDAAAKPTYIIYPIQMTKIRYIIKKPFKEGETYIYVKGLPVTIMSSDPISSLNQAGGEKQFSTPGFREGLELSNNSFEEVHGLNLGVSKRFKSSATSEIVLPKI